MKNISKTYTGPRNSQTGSPTPSLTIPLVHDSEEDPLLVSSLHPLLRLTPESGLLLWLQEICCQVAPGIVSSNNWWISLVQSGTRFSCYPRTDILPPLKVVRTTDGDSCWSNTPCLCNGATGDFTASRQMVESRVKLTAFALRLLVLQVW